MATRQAQLLSELNCSCCDLIYDPCNALQSELIRILQVGLAAGVRYFKILARVGLFNFINWKSHLRVFLYFLKEISRHI